MDSIFDCSTKIYYYICIAFTYTKADSPSSHLFYVIIFWHCIRPCFSPTVYIKSYVLQIRWCVLIGALVWETIITLVYIFVLLALNKISEAASIPIDIVFVSFVFNMFIMLCADDADSIDVYSLFIFCAVTSMHQVNRKLSTDTCMHFLQYRILYVPACPKPREFIIKWLWLVGWCQSHISFILIVVSFIFMPVPFKTDFMIWIMVILQDRASI